MEKKTQLDIENAHYGIPLSRKKNGNNLNIKKKTTTEMFK